jgi:aryl-alcohol dehydrogenase-like predicted oxidoreductase
LRYFAVSKRRKAMKTKQLGNTGMNITAIGFGAWAIGGGDWQYGWGPQDDNESVAAIRRALDLGINWIDTAAQYGLGHSEEVVARALKGISQKPLVFTKCSMTWDEHRRTGHSLKRDSVIRECENSLRRLNSDVIDLYQVHWPKDEEIEEGWETLAMLKQQGKVRYIGVSNFSVEQMKRIQKIAPISSLQPAYSLANTSNGKEIIPFCGENNIGVIVYSPMASGLLTGTMTRDRFAALPPEDWRHRSGLYQEPALTKNLAIAEGLKKIAARKGCNPGEVAIAWTLVNPAVTAAIVGARSAAQVDGFIRGAEIELNADDLQEINGLLE